MTHICRRSFWLRIGRPAIGPVRIFPAFELPNDHALLRRLPFNRYGLGAAREKFDAAVGQGFAGVWQELFRLTV